MARRKRRSRNPSALVTTLVTVGAVAAASTAVAVAMVRQRGKAMRECDVVVTLAQAAGATIGGLS